jgi:hypothetical protein
MKTKELTRKQILSVRCPTCGVAVGKRCILIAGGTRNKRHRNRRLLAAEALERKGIRKRQLEALASAQHVASKKESDRALLARLKRESAKPVLTKSVRDETTKKQPASWNAR